MSNTPHEIHADFPEYHDAIYELKQNDPHFKKIADTYHTVNRDIHRAETDIEPTTDQHLYEMRKHRVVLKDEIFKMLKESAETS